MSSTSLETSRHSVATALQTTYGITLLRGVLATSAGQAVLSLLQALVASEPNAIAIAIAYSTAFSELARVASRGATAVLTDAWQSYLLTHLIDDANLWSTQVERQGSDGVTSALRAQVQRDLHALHLLFQLDAQTLWQLTSDSVTPELPALRDCWVPWHDLASLDKDERNSARGALARCAVESTDWTTLIEPLEAYWMRHGTGPLAHYHVLRWQGINEGLQGIAYPDPVQLSNLIGYEREQSLLKSNIERFLSDLSYA